LISYLDQKSAASVISLPNEEKPVTLMHVFTPNCQISSKLVKQLAPNLKRSIADTDTSPLVDSDFIIILLFKN
jgi:hypothetical protein